MTKSKYCIPVAWTVDLDIHVEAEDIAEAVLIAEAHPLPRRGHPLPEDNAVFRPGSFEVYEEDITIQVKACHRTGVDALPPSKSKPKPLTEEGA